MEKTLAEKQATDKKNEFALKLLDVFNEEYLTHQHGCAEADVLRDRWDDPVYDKKGEVVFVDCDDNKMNASDLIEWYNITMFDPDCQGEITLTMKVWHGKAIEAGYITEETKNSW